jgi:hypothetical protein
MACESVCVCCQSNERDAKKGKDKREMIARIRAGGRPPQVCLGPQLTRGASPETSLQVAAVDGVGGLEMTALHGHLTPDCVRILYCPSLSALCLGQLRTDLRLEGGRHHSTSWSYFAHRIPKASWLPLRHLDSRFSTFEAVSPPIGYRPAKGYLWTVEVTNWWIETEDP